MRQFGADQADGVGGILAEGVLQDGAHARVARPAQQLAAERPDVLPVGDLGIRRAIERAYELDALPEAAEIERIAAPWHPYRTLACRYLWQSLRNRPM